MFENFWGRLGDILKENPAFLLEALKTTIIIAFCGFALGLIIGTLIAVLRTSSKKSFIIKVLDKIAAFYVLIIRGTPIVVQLLLLYFVLLPSFRLDAIYVAIFAFGINSSAYMAETLRGAINSIDKGQLEAGRALGLSYWQTVRKVILPQAFKNAIPALGNEIITLVKETSVVGFITVIDITRASQLVIAHTYDAIVPYFLLAFVYLILVYLLTSIMKLLEKKLFEHGR